LTQAATIHRVHRFTGAALALIVCRLTSAMRYISDMPLPRKSRLVVLALLVLIGLRGLIPVGYMIDATDHGWSLVVCDDGIYGDWASKSADHHPDRHQGHHHQHDDENDGKKSHNGSTCPFALASVAAPLPNVSPVVVEKPCSEAVTDETSVIFAGLYGPARVHQSRAPPRFSNLA
jgi:hypothetical protein